MNVSLNVEVTATVRWNALEHSMMSYKYTGDRNGYSGESEYNIHQLRNINADLADELDPDGPDEIPGRFKTDDMHGTVPLQELFDRTETLLANMERMSVIVDQFHYDPEAEL